MIPLVLHARVKINSRQQIFLLKEILWKGALAVLLLGVLLKEALWKGVLLKETFPKEVLQTEVPLRKK